MAGRFVRASKYRECPRVQLCLWRMGLTIATRPRLWEGYEEGMNTTSRCATDCTHISQEQCYDNLRISKNAWDTNLIKVSIALHATLEHDRSYPLRPILSTSPSTGKQVVVVLSLSSPSTRMAAHTAAVLDTDWYAHILAKKARSGAHDPAGVRSTTG
jgi:hypothetical protein